MMKKLACILVAALLCVALTTAALAETVYVSSTGSGTLNLRKGPGKKYGVTGYVRHGDTVTEFDTDGDWSLVTVARTGESGWIKTMYFDGTTEDLGTGRKELDISGKYLTMRKGPGTKYGKAARVYAYETVKVLNTEDDWCRVSTSNGNYGWLKLKYIGEDATDVPEVDVDVDEPTYTGKSYKVRSVTAKSGLNVRTGAGSKYPVINTLPKGTPVMILGTSGSWYKISTLGGQIGWVSKKYTTANAKAVVTASVLRVRKGPSTSYAKLGGHKKNTVVTIDSIAGNWAHVISPKPKGYMALKYLKF